jgi:hypothetical protein
MELLCDVESVESHFGPFGDSSNLHVGQLEAHIGLFGDSANLDAR